MQPIIATAYVTNVSVSFGFDPNWRDIGLITALILSVWLVCVLIRRR